VSESLLLYPLDLAVALEQQRRVRVHVDEASFHWLGSRLVDLSLSRLPL